MMPTSAIVASVGNARTVALNITLVVATLGAPASKTTRFAALIAVLGLAMVTAWADAFLLALAEVGGFIGAFCIHEELLRLHRRSRRLLYHHEVECRRHQGPPGGLPAHFNNAGA